MEYSPDDLDRKLSAAFDGKVVRKDLLHRIKKGTNVPTFVLEFLLARYCASDDAAEIQAGMEAVLDTLNENYVRPNDANAAQSRVATKGKHRFIDKVHVNYVEKDRRHWAALENFDSRRVAISEKYYRDNDRLLQGGLWAEVTVAFNEVEDDKYTFYVEDLRPIQLSRFDFERYCEGRTGFSRDEWMDVILRSVGLEPSKLSKRVKFHFIARLAPLIEASRTAPSCKRKDILNLKASDITAWWDKVIDGLALGLQILRDDCKVTKPKWLPYQTMLLPLAAALAKTDMPSTPETGVKRERIKRWFWCAVFGQAYESSPNSQAARDVGDLGVWLEGGAEPEVVRELRFDPKALRDITPRQRAVYRGTICLVLGSGTGARDFHTQAVITGKLIDQEGIDDHHVFPAAYLRDAQGIQSTVARDCVLNRTLIDRTTNQIISARAPSDYLAAIQATPGFPFDTVLASHCLPVGEGSPLIADDYDAFLVWRQQRLWQEIQRVTGLKLADDLEDPVETAE